MVHRLLLAYFIIALMVMAGALLVWHLTKGRRAYRRSRRAHHRAKQNTTARS